MFLNLDIVAQSVEVNFYHAVIWNGQALLMFKNFFIPNKNNDYYPSSIRPRFMYTYMVFMIIFNLFSAHFLSDFPTVVNAASTYTSSDIISLTNQDRADNGISALNENSELDSAAQAKMADMFQYQYWAHYNPVTGASPWSFIVAAGYSYQYAGENLAEGYWTAQDVNNAWMNSTEHRANILDGDYKDIGVAVQEGNLLGSDVIVVVEMFGTKMQTVVPTPYSTPTPTQTVVSTPAPIRIIKPSPTFLKPTIIINTPTSTPTAIPAIISSITPTTTPTSIPTTLTNKVTPTAIEEVKKVYMTPQQNLIEDFTGRVNSMSFANKVDIIVALFLLVVFSLDGFYYYKIKDIHKRAGINSLAHIPLLLILLAICIIGTSGVTL